MCKECGKPLLKVRPVLYGGEKFHPECFVIWYKNLIKGLLDQMGGD